MVGMIAGGGPLGGGGKPGGGTVMGSPKITKSMINNKIHKEGEVKSNA